jgi:hypothetical protein
MKILIIILSALALISFVNRKLSDEKDKPCDCGGGDFKNLKTLFIPMEECTKCNKTREACF